MMALLLGGALLSGCAGGLRGGEYTTQIRTDPIVAVADETFDGAAIAAVAFDGWPGVELFNNGQPFVDCKQTPVFGAPGCDVYTAGTFTLTATAVSDSSTIAKVVFGKSTDGGAIWTNVEDTTPPYSANFPTTAGETVIFRAQAFDTAGKKSLFAANRIYIKSP